MGYFQKLTDTVSSIFSVVWKYRNITWLLVKQ